MANYELELYHHGRFGQKWGKKNGPPYPLNFDDLSEEERAKAKKRTIDEGDVKTATANRNHYTNKELNDVMVRFDINQRINKLAAADIQTGKDKAREFCEKMDTVANVANKVSNGIEAGSRVYNSIAKLANSLGDANLPIIGEKKEKENKGTRETQVEYKNGKMVKSTVITQRNGLKESVTRRYDYQNNNDDNNNKNNKNQNNKIDRNTEMAINQLRRSGHYSDTQMDKILKDINKMYK